MLGSFHFVKSQLQLCNSYWCDSACYLSERNGWSVSYLLIRSKHLSRRASQRRKVQHTVITGQRHSTSTLETESGRASFRRQFNSILAYGEDLSWSVKVLQRNRTGKSSSIPLRRRRDLRGHCFFTVLHTALLITAPDTQRVPSRFTPCTSLDPYI